MDEDKTEDQTIESTETTEESPVEETTNEEVPEESADKEQVEPSAPEEAPAPSRRENLRIQQVLSRLKNQPQQPQQQAEGMDYRQALDAPDEVYQQLEADRQAYAQAQQGQTLDQVNSAKWEMFLNLDAPKVESKYPQLDKNSPDFQPAIADAINEEYLYLVGYDAQRGTVAKPQLRYSDFVEARMELANRIAGEKVAQSSKNIARQTASMGLRPDGSSAKTMNLNKDPGSMTNEELNAKIAQDLKTHKTIR